MKVVCVTYVTPSMLLQTLPGLTDQQKGVCAKVPETVESVPFGTRQVSGGWWIHGHVTSVLSTLV